MGEVVKLHEELPDSPINQAATMCSFLAMDAKKIAGDCALMPEVYLNEYEQLLEISFQASRALEILGQYQRNQILSRFEIRE